MRFKKCGSYYKMYVDHPEIFQCLYLFDENNKVLGFSMIYDNQYRSKKIYTCDTIIENVINKYLKKNNYKFMFEQISFKLKKSNYKKYPYMDDLVFLDPINNIIANFSPLCYRIARNDGSYDNHSEIRTCTQYDIKQYEI